MKNLDKITTIKDFCIYYNTDYLKFRRFVLNSSNITPVYDFTAVSVYNTIDLIESLLIFIKKYDIEKNIINE